MESKAAPMKTALFWSATQTGLRMALSFLSIKVTAVYLGPAGLALTAQLGNLLMLLQGAIGTAIETGVVNMTAQPEREKSLAALWSAAMKLALGLSAVVAILMIVASQAISDWLLMDRRYWLAIVAAAATIPFSLAGMVFTSALNGMKKVHFVGMVNTGAVLLGSLVFIPLAYLFGLWGGLIGTALSTCGACCVASVLILRSQSVALRSFFGPLRKDLLFSLVAYYPMLLVHSIVEPGTWILVRNIVSASQGLESAGQWQAAMRLSDMLVIILRTAVSMHLMAHLSSTRDADFGRELAIAVLRLAALSAIGAAAMYLLRELVVAIVFTKQFSQVSLLLPYILVGDVLKVAALPLQMALVIKLRGKAYVLNIVLMAVTAIGLTWHWLPSMGSEAASAAYAAASATALIYLILVCKGYWHEPRHTAN
jgi:PST family polysaccharide transporter